MKGSVVFDLLTSMMADDWRSASPLPSTSQDFIDPIIRLDEPEVTEDPRYEEVLQSLYSVDSQPDPLWTSTSTSTSTSVCSTISNVFSPPLSSDSNSFDFLSDDSFIDIMQVQTNAGVKGCLKSRIKAKRKASGQDEISVDEEPRSKQDAVPKTEDDIQEYYERKEKNRLAAQKCRSKKRERADDLEHDIGRLESRQDNLKDEIQRLQDEQDHLQEVIQIHGIVCPKMRKMSDS